MASFKRFGIKALTFDLFGTVLDLGGSLTPAIGKWLKEVGAEGGGVSAGQFWYEWRYRQRLGHSGYLPVVRRSAVYVARQFGIVPTSGQIDRLMGAWQKLDAFDDVIPAMKKLSKRYRLVALSNGEASYLAHLVKNRIKWKFD